MIHNPRHTEHNIELIFQFCCKRCSISLLKYVCVDYPVTTMRIISNVPKADLDPNNQMVQRLRSNTKLNVFKATIYFKKDLGSQGYADVGMNFGSTWIRAAKVKHDHKMDRDKLRQN